MQFESCYINENIISQYMNVMCQWNEAGWLLQHRDDNMHGSTMFPIPILFFIICVTLRTMCI